MQSSNAAWVEVWVRKLKRAERRVDTCYLAEKESV